MKIQRIFNNNIVATCSSDGSEMIVTGPGIGYSKKIGDDIENYKIEKRFRIENAQKNKFYHMLEKIPVEYFEISELIFNRASKKMKYGISSQVVLMLTDHIAFAIDRKKQGILLPNLLLSEIKKLYPREYEVGIWAVKIIGLKTKVALPEDEAGFIAMHLINANSSEDNYANMILTFSKDVLELMEKYIFIEKENKSHDYVRLSLHLKYLAQQIFNKRKSDNQENNHEKIVDCVIKGTSEVEECVCRIAEYIKNNYDYTLDKQDRFYLMIHILKITS